MARTAKEDLSSHVDGPDQQEEASPAQTTDGADNRSKSSLDETSAHDLPQLLPLSHDHPLLNHDVPFNVDDFLMTRPNTSLVDLRTELRDYLGTLKEELVQLINDDYEDFISLRTDLRGEGPRLQRLLGPIQSLHGETERSKTELLEIKMAFEEKLKERSRLREEKALLHLLLKVSDLVGRLETMLRISDHQDSTNVTPDYSSMVVRDMTDSLDAIHFEGPYTRNVGEPDTKRSPAVGAKFLARVAAEFNQLLYHAAKARQKDCVFVEELRKNITKIEDTLSRDLDIVFSASLVAVISASPSTTAPPASRPKLIADLTECLKIYDSLEKWESAEDVIRQDIVQPFIRKTITSSALSAPVSPVMPRTPVADSLHVSRDSPILTIDSPITPFTPHHFYPTRDRSLATSNTTSQLSISTVGGLPSFTDQIHSEDPLTQLLSTVLRFIERDLIVPIELSERINSTRSTKIQKGGIKSVLTPTTNGQLGSTGEQVDCIANKSTRIEGGFDIMARVVWAEIARALIDQLGPIIFAAGRPDEFQKNYTIIHDFITAFEFTSPSVEVVNSIRSHRIYKAFERRWQLQVYFQLRWKEIIGKLEETLSQAPTMTTPQISAPFITAQGEAVVTALCTCWSSTVYIPELVHRFWRLSLQILHRFITWVDANIPVRKNPDLVPEKKNAADVAAQEDAHLRAFAFMISDILVVKSKAQKLFSQTIRGLLPSTSQEDDEQPPEEIFNETLSKLSAIIPPISDEMISILSVRCQDPLQYVRSIPTQFRAMSSRNLDLPQEPSYFIPNILKPLKEFLLEDGAPASQLKSVYGSGWAEEIFKSVVLKYSSYLIGMKKTYDSIRRYKKGKQSAFMLFGSTSRNQQLDEQGREEARIRAQMIIDVEALGQEASSLDGLINVQASEEYRELRELAARDDATSATS
ncbi:oligomeric golgi complex component, COG2-domain-containing protein [Cantharellus anzutake]|uniref:oligomeric golgi complex component, COG2-domain-containing protein n=1 Tax=Cantharellus anzutake TaxID=1750568 RepID=UPI0019071C3C|nr:oligomeric golgi complex component, COG2-domain-containing protein [Cantharellus anzutake]KAF8342152.1 oligomeric golgi complex component, COG2-domain-containing protein [Cantharellus anzutake]